MEKVPYPKSVFFIIVCEFCERFGFYGMHGNVLHIFSKRMNIDAWTFLIICVLIFKAVLILYFKNVLEWSEHTSIVWKTHSISETMFDLKLKVTRELVLLVGCVPFLDYVVQLQSPVWRYDCRIFIRKIQNHFLPVHCVQRRKCFTSSCCDATLTNSIYVCKTTSYGCFIADNNFFFYFSSFSMIGLTLIAVGTGGIKPCV